MRNVAVLLFTLSLVGACSGPVGPIPGGALEGTPAAWPDDWAYTDDIENVLLQTNAQDPYSVTVWIVQLDNVPYIAAGDKNSQWVQHMRDDPNVILSINGRLIDARVADVTANTELAQISKAYFLKYEMEEEDFADRDGLLFRLAKP